MFTTKFTAILAAIVLLAAATAAFGVTDLRFWAWKGDLEQVAEITYLTRISQKSGEWLAASDRLDKCQKEPPRDCSFLARRVDDLEREIKRLEMDRDKLRN